MTPAIEVLDKNKVSYKLYEYEHDPANNAYGLEAAEKLGVDKCRLFKTLVVRLSDNSLAVGIVPVAFSLNMKSLAKAAGCKKAEMADKMAVQRTTGYIPGGVSPLGQKKKLATFIDISAEQYETIFVSAGRRGLQMELKPDDLRKLTAGIFVRIGQ